MTQRPTIAKKVGEVLTFETKHEAVRWFCQNFALVPKAYRLHEVRMPYIFGTRAFKNFYVWAQNQSQAAGFVFAYLGSSPQKVRFDISDPKILELVKSVPEAVQRRLNIVENGKEIRKLREF